MPLENEKNILYDSDIIILKLMNMYNNRLSNRQEKNVGGSKYTYKN